MKVMFTGHRAKVCPVTESARRFLADCITAAYYHGCREFYSGGALGVDQTAAELVLQLKKADPEVSLIVALPCANYHETWQPYQVSRLASILRGANQIILVNNIDQAVNAAGIIGGVYKSSKVKFTPWAWADLCRKRDQYMVSQTTECIAVWNGDAKTGTYRAMKMAKSSGLGVLVIPATGDKPYWWFKPLVRLI